MDDAYSQALVKVQHSEQRARECLSLLRALLKERQCAPAPPACAVHGQRHPLCAACERFALHAAADAELALFSGAI